MRANATALALVLAVASAAYAEGPIVVRASVGVTVDRDFKSYDHGYAREATKPIGPGFQLDIGYRFMGELAAGLHFGVARHSSTYEFFGNIPGSHRVEDRVFTPLQLGIGAQWSRDRFWVAPWVGFLEGAGATRQLAFGFGGGADVYIAPSGHRVGAYVEIAHARSRLDEYDEPTRAPTYLSAGIAYRYW